MKKILIFGVGGFVGNYLSREFLNHGYDVYGSDKLDIKPVVLHEAVHYVSADLMDAAGVQAIVSDIAPDMIINLAAISSVGLSWNIPQMTISVNVVAALNIMEAVRKCENRPRVMFIGSSEEYEITDQPISEDTPLNANNPYGISKVTQERFAEIYRSSYDMKIYCVRPFNHTGVGQRDTFVLPGFCRQAADIEKSGKAGTIKVGNLSVKRDFGSVRDVVRAYRMIIEQEDCTKIYNVGSGEAYSLQELLEYVISLSTQQISIEVDPKRFRPEDNPVICCDNSLISRELGWQPKEKIFDILKEMYEYYLDH